MPVFQMAQCLAATANWCSFFFVYVYIKIHVVREIWVLPSLTENLLSVEYYWHQAFGFLSHISQLSHKYFIKSLTAYIFFHSSQSTLRWSRRGTCAEIFSTGGCETSWTATRLSKVHYLSSKMDKLELLNTTRSDISCISALFLWKTWLSSAIPDGVVDPQDYMQIQGDCDT